MKELLFLLCRYPFDETNRMTLSVLLGTVSDWPRMVKLINAHGIIALAAYNIKEAGLEKNIPAEAMALLEEGLMQSVVRNTWLTERWKEVNDILTKAGIKHILLKGMALEHTLYGSKGLRQMNDNDILLTREDSHKAWNLLQKEGFRLEPFKSFLFKKIIFDFGRHLPALYKDGYMIEIHDNLLYQKEVPGSHFPDPFKDPVEISINKTKAYILSKELQLKHLIKHFDGHTLAGDCQLRLYADIKLLDSEINIELPEAFITDPLQSNRTKYRRAAYKTTINSISPKNRLRFIIGDTFPSLKWMKNRHKCNGFEALLFYPQRIGKLLWLW